MTGSAVDLWTLAPLLVVAAGALGTLLLELFLRPRAEGRGDSADRTSARVGAALSLLSAAVLGTAITIAANAFAGGTAISSPAARPLLIVDPLASFATAAIAGITLLVGLLSTRYLQKLRIHRGEAYALLLLSAAGMIVLVSAVDLAMVFLGIEGMSVPLYVLAGLDRHRLGSSEGALKLFLSGAFASALALFGMALLYGTTGTTSFEGVRAGLAEAGALGRVGAALLFAGFAFRVAAVPFHSWAPDVEEGAPAPVAAFISVGVRTAAFIGLLRVLQSALGPADAAMLDVLRVLAVGTMILGSVMAVVQGNLERLLAYVGIAHAGFLLTAFLAETAAATAALLFAAVAFAFANLGAYGVLIAMTVRGTERDRLEDLVGLAQRRPALAAGLTLFLFSLAGIPGTAGFIARLQLLLEAVRAGEVGVAVFGGVASLILLYAVLRVPVVMYMRPPEPEASRPRLGSAEGLVLLFCASAVLWLGLVPNGTFFAEGLRFVDWTQAAGLLR